MRVAPFVLLLAALLTSPLAAQTRVAPKKDPTFPEAVEAAEKAFEKEIYGEAVSALQAAIKAVQKLQRTAILAALPTPEGLTFEDEEPVDMAGNPFAVGTSALGLTVTRHYRSDDRSIDVEVIANSPLVSMVAVMFANPEIVKADGGELIEYEKHKAILKKSGDAGLELTILMHGKHVIKATSEGLSIEDLLKVFDQAAVDRLEKPLGA
jgi:hypothetical protein